MPWGRYFQRQCFLPAGKTSRYKLPLTDFAKLVDLFDSRRVPFVRFEREVTAERIREIYRQYLALDCLRRLQNALKAPGLADAGPDEPAMGLWRQQAVQPRHLYQNLSTPVYRRMVAHKGKVFPGQHLLGDKLVDDCEAAAQAMQSPMDWRGQRKALGRGKGMQLTEWAQLKVNFQIFPNPRIVPEGKVMAVTPRSSALRTASRDAQRILPHGPMAKKTSRSVEISPSVGTESSDIEYLNCAVLHSHEASDLEFVKSTVYDLPRQTTQARDFLL